MTNSPLRSRKRRLGRGLLRLLDVLLVALIVLGMYVAWVGVPNWLVRRWLAPKPDHAFALDIARLRFSPFSGFVADDVRLFRRHAIGPALLEARRAEAHISVIELVAGRQPLTGVTIRNGLVRPAMLAHMGGNQKQKPAGSSRTLRIVIEGMEIEGVWVQALEGTFSGDADAWRLDDLYAMLEHRSQTLEGRGGVACDRDGTLSGQGTAEGEPAVLIPFFDAARVRIATKIVRNFTFPESLPRGDWSFTVSPGKPRDAAVRFQLWLEHPTYRGVEADRAEVAVQLSWADRAFTAEVRPLTIVRPEGTARGGLTIRTLGEQRSLEFDAVSGIEPGAAAQMVGVWTNEVRTRFRFEPPYTMSGNGLVNLRNPHDSALDADLAFGALVTGGQAFRDVGFKFRRVGATNTINDLKATWFDGTMLGRVEWRPSPVDVSNTQFRMELDVNQASFEALAAAFVHGKKDAYSGALSGRIALDGLAGTTNRASWRGNGALAVNDGRVFMLPVFGGLSEFLADVIPGLNMVIGQSDVRADFSISDGRVHTDRLLVEGDVLSLLGRGSYSFDGALDFDIQLTFLKSRTLMGKLVRVPTWIFSKLFEFRLTGTRREPHWYPVNFSKDLWQKRESPDNNADDVLTEEELLMEWEEAWQ